MSDSISRSWFAVFNNPEQHGYSGSPLEIVNKLKDEWIKDKPERKGYWAYCISAQGLPHIHMILENTVAMRFPVVKKTYPSAHLSPTKGNKKQIMDYILKNPPFDEKGEKVIESVSYGNIEGYKKYSLLTGNDILITIDNLIEEGMTPYQIMAEDIRFRKEESLVKKAYFAKRYKETPPKRNVTVTWHLGESGSGKTYCYIELCEKYGEDNVYFFSDYSNKGVGGFDNYCGEPILFMDELKPHSLPFELLLTITQGYRTQIHCRYTNCYALWNEVHITSVYSPEEIFRAMVSNNTRHIDTINQLLRRIDKYIFHYVENGEYKSLEIDSNDYDGTERIKLYLLKGGKNV